MASTVPHQRIRGPVQLHRPHGLEVHPQQLAERTALAQPRMGRPLRGGMRQTADDRTHRRRAQRPVHPQLGHQLHQAQLRQRPQTHRFDADAARAHQVQGIDIHRLQVAPGRCAVCGCLGRRRAAGQQLRGDALGFFFERGGRLVEQGRLTVEDLIDALAQTGPLLMAKWPPRLSSVRWRTLEPMRWLFTSSGCSRSGRRYGGFGCDARTWGGR